MKKMNSDKHKSNDKLELMAEEVRSSSLAYAIANKHWKMDGG